MYDAETRPRLYSGEPARQGDIVDTSKVNQGPSGGTQNVYAGTAVATSSPGRFGLPRSKTWVTGRFVGGSCQQ